MATITVKNIPPDLYERLKAAAEAHRRSLNREVIACLEQAVRAHRPEPELVLTRARLLREATAAYPLGDEEIRQAKAAGRP